MNKIKNIERELANILKTNFDLITGNANKIYIQDFSDSTILEDLKREQRTEDAPNHIMIMATQDEGLETDLLLKDDEYLDPNLFVLIYEMTNKFGIYFTN